MHHKLLPVCLCLAAVWLADAAGTDVSAQAARQTQDEYLRIELGAEIGSLTLIEELAVTTPGAKEWVMPLGHMRQDVVSVTDMMTGQPLKFTVTSDAVRIALARPIAGEGGQARVRVVMSPKGAQGYFRLRDAPGPPPDTRADIRKERARADALGDVMLSAGVPWTRNAVVLPAGYRLVACNIPSQVLTRPDGRTEVSFMHQHSDTNVMSIQVRARPDAQTGDAAKPKPLTNARSWEPPPSQGPTERARLSERAAQDRDIVYFLQPPDTHAFSLYHDYTESREGSDKYLNVVRAGSKVSAPSGVVLDTGEAMKVEVLKGTELAAAGIDAGAGGAGQVAPDQEVVVFRYPAVKAGQSLRLRLSETYTAPESYRLDGDDLVFERSLGRPRNSIVLPKGWYLTALSIPGVIRETPDGETRINFLNPRPDAIDVLLKGRRVAKQAAASK